MGGPLGGMGGPAGSQMRPGGGSQPIPRGPTGAMPGGMPPSGPLGAPVMPTMQPMGPPFGRCPDFLRGLRLPWPRVFAPLPVVQQRCSTVVPVLRHVRLPHG